MSEEKKDEVLIPSLVVGAITFYIYSFHSVLTGLVTGILTALATFALLTQWKIQLLRRITIISVTALMWTAFLLYLNRQGVHGIQAIISRHERIPLIPGPAYPTGVALFPCPLTMPEIIINPERILPLGFLITFPPSFDLFLLVTAIYVVTTLLIGKAWCGWLCPFGGVSEVVTLVSSEKWRLPKTREKKILTDRSLVYGGLRIEIREIKYGILLATVLLAVYSQIQWFCTFCWAGTISWFGSILNFLAFLAIFAASFILLPLMTKHKWCHTLCPIGAGLSLADRASLFTIEIDKSKCNRCYQCLDVCPTYAITLEAIDKGGKPSLQCEKCGICIESCPNSAIKMRIARSRIVAKTWFIPVIVSLDALWYFWFVHATFQLLGS